MAPNVIYKSGQNVEVFQHDTQGWLPAKVIKQNMRGSYSIQYLNDRIQHAVSRELIRCMY